MSLSKLDAVNRMLRAIGETPVSQLNDEVPDAEEAERTLDETSLEVQSQGWYYNTDEEYTLTPTTDKRIKLSPTIHRVDTVGTSACVPVTVRRDIDGQIYLWNIDDQSFEFNSTLKVDIVRIFDFEALPYELKAYIAAKAARIYQEREMGSVALDNFTSRREAETWAALLDRESEMSDRNVLRDSPDMAAATYRNNDLR